MQNLYSDTQPDESGAQDASENVMRADETSVVQETQEAEAFGNDVQEAVAFTQTVQEAGAFAQGTQTNEAFTRDVQAEKVVVQAAQEEAVYAGFWVRLAAFLLDHIIVFVILLAARLVLIPVTSLTKGTFLDGNILFQYSLKDILLYVVQVLYFILCTYYTGSTLGKKALNLRVESAVKGQELRLIDVVYRETVGRFLCSISIGIGYLLVALDKEKRGIHDMLSDTRVVYAKRVKIYPFYAVPKPVVSGGNVPVRGLVKPVSDNGAEGSPSAGQEPSEAFCPEREETADHNPSESFCQEREADEGRQEE